MDKVPLLKSEPITPDLIFQDGTALDLATLELRQLPLTKLSTDLTPEQRRDSVRQFVKKVNQADDALGLLRAELLYEIDMNQYWKSWTYLNEVGIETPYASFDDYCSKEFGINERKAQHFLAIYKKLVVELKLPTERLIGMEWSKIREVVRILTPDNVDEILRLTKELSQRQVVALIQDMTKAHTANAPEPSTEPVQREEEPQERATKETKELVFQLFPEVYEVVISALELAGELAKTTKRGPQLELIVANFLGGVIGHDTSAAAFSLDQIVRSLNNVYSVHGVQVQIVGQFKE